MPSNILVYIENDVYELAFDLDLSIVIHKGKKYQTLLDLVLDSPRISNEDEPIAFAKIANHLLFGNQFKLIERPSEYVQRYWQQIVQERDKPSDDPKKNMLWHVTFDVNQIKAPVIEDEIMICFLEHIRLGLPFSLKMPFPFNKPEYHIKLDPLPIIR